MRVSPGFTVLDEQLTLNGAGFNGIGALDNLEGSNTWAGSVILSGTSGQLGSGSTVSIGAETVTQGTTAGVATNLIISGVVSNDPNGAFTSYNLTKVGFGRLVLNNIATTSKVER